MFLRIPTDKFTNSSSDPIASLCTALAEADTVILGAGAGLSASAGFTYSGPRFQEHFADFAARYGFTDMYSGGFYPTTRRKSTGPTGAATSLSTAIRTPRSQYITNY